LIRKFLATRFPAVGWTIFIFILLALPGSMLPKEEKFSIPNFDKYIHITLFAVFVVLWSYYYVSKPGISKSIFIKFLIISMLYGTAMEFVQKYFIPGRDFDLYDILADIIGALAGYLFVLLFVVPRKAVNEYKK